MICKANIDLSDTANSKQRHSDSDEAEVIDSTPERELENERRYPKRNRVPRISAIEQYCMRSTVKRARKLPKKHDDELNKMDFWYSWYKWSDCKLAQQYDKERNFFPQPGPSNLNYYEDDNIIGYYRPVLNSPTNGFNGCEKQSVSTGAANNKQTLARSPSKKRINSNATPQRYSSRKAKAQKMDTTNRDSSLTVKSPILSENSDWEDDIRVQSFYEQSFVQNAPTPTHNMFNGVQSDDHDDAIINISNSNSSNDSLANQTISTPMISKFLESLQNSSELKVQRLRPRPKAPDSCSIKPGVRAPYPNDVNNALLAHELPKVIHPVPFYSDPNDVIANNSKKEIGHTVLQLTGNALANCDEFKSQLNVLGINRWQRLIGMRAIRHSQRIIDNKVLNNENTIRTFLAKEKPVLITPTFEPPSKENVYKWIDMRAKIDTKKRTSDQHLTVNGNYDHDSPEKIRREKAIAALNERNDEQMADDVKQIPNEIMRVLRSKKDITVSMVPTRGKGHILKSQSDDENKTRFNNDHDDNDNGNDYKDGNGDEDEDDVICLDDDTPTKRRSSNKFTKLVRSTQ